MLYLRITLVEHFASMTCKPEGTNVGEKREISTNGWYGT